MKSGIVKPEGVIKKLEDMGGLKEHHGGEVKMKFPGTTIIVGRHDFSRAMMAGVKRKLRRAGIEWDDTNKAA